MESSFYGLCRNIQEIVQALLSTIILRCIHLSLFMIHLFNLIFWLKYCYQKCPSNFIPWLLRRKIYHRCAENSQPNIRKFFFYYYFRHLSEMKKGMWITFTPMDYIIIFCLSYHPPHRNQLYLTFQWVRHWLLGYCEIDTSLDSST